MPTRRRRPGAPHGARGFGWSAVELAHLRFVVVVTGWRRDLAELGELRSGELDTVGGDVLLEAGHALGAGDRSDPLALGEQPGQRDLRGRHAGRGSNLPHLVGDPQVVLEILPFEARVALAEVP